ncbi:MAG: TolC family protein [Flavobacteriaceae bacterium]|nr:TolC family protein [Flavobacteriaceae bacterium]
MKTTIAFLLAIFISFAGFSQESTIKKSKKWSLKESVVYALEHNLSVKRADLTSSLRKEDITLAKSSFLPTVSGSSSQSFSFGSSVDLATNTRKSADRRSNSFGVNASATFFNGFKNTNIFKQSKLSYESSKFDLQKMKDDISLNVLNSYLNVLFNKENLKIAQAQVVLSTEQVDRTKRLVESGVQPKGNLLDVEATLASDEGKLIDAQNNLELALLNLAQLLQLPKEGFDIQDVNVEVTSTKMLYNDVNGIYTKSLNLRPEIKSAQLRIKNAKLGIDVAKADYLPSVNMNVGFNTFYNHNQGKKDDFINPITGDLVSNGFFTQLDNNFGQSVNLSLRIPIFSGFRTNTNVAKAKINFLLSQNNLTNEKLRLRESIERAFTDAKSSLKSFEAARKSFAAQTESFRFAKERFEAGQSTSFDFNQVKNRLVDVQAALYRAKFNFIFKTKLLEFYYGIPVNID